MIEKKRNKPNREIIFFISFSDMMSLLMTFFVLLFSMSTLDTVKFKKMSVSLTSLFTEQKENLIEEFEMEERILKKIYDDLQLYITREKLEEFVSVKVENHSIVMDLGSKLLFTIAKAELKDDAYKILGAFVGYFQQVEEANIVVEGHTDDIPIKTAEFSSNWELSAARAASVVHFLVDNGIKEQNCYIIGYNQYRPLVANDTEENKSKNRRVRIIFKPIVGGTKDETKVDLSGIRNFTTDTEVIEATKNVDIGSEAKKDEPKLTGKESNPGRRNKNN